MGENDIKETIKQTEYRDNIESIRAVRDLQNSLRIDTILNAIQRRLKSDDEKEDEKELNYLLGKQFRTQMKHNVTNKKYTQLNLSSRKYKELKIILTLKKIK